eukprot:UN31019
MDTLKTRLQNSHRFNTSIFRNLYAGVLFPLLFTPASWTLVVGIYGEMLKKTDSKHIYQHVLSGSVAGIMWGSLLTPIDNIKCNSQIMRLSSKETIRLISSTRGGLYNSLKRGFSFTLARDVVGLGTYFGAYEYLDRLARNRKFEPEYLPVSFYTGGLSSVACWLIVLPLDCLKTRYQVNYHLTGWRETYQDIASLRNLYRGIQITVLRTFILGAVSWTTIEKAKEMLQMQRLSAQIN